MRGSYRGLNLNRVPIIPGPEMSIKISNFNVNPNALSNTSFGQDRGGKNNHVTILFTFDFVHLIFQTR